MKTAPRYSFGRSYNNWGIWDASGTKIMTVYTFEEAIRETYRLNGWGEPKTIKRRF